MKKLFIVFVLIFSTLNANIAEAKKVYYDKDFKKAFLLLEQLRKGGNIESNYYLGNMYQYGNGVKQDFKKAFEYYTLASSLPNEKRLKSTFSIALMYSKGLGVKESHKKAFNFFKILDKENIGVAQYMMGLMYSEGKGVEQDIHEAVAYFEKGCSNKFAEACYVAGNFYENGIELGIERIYPIVKEFYKKGCALGSTESCEAVKNIKDPRPFYEKYWYPIMAILLPIMWWRMWNDKKRKSNKDTLEKEIS
jgi:TPR repeat protein